MFGNEAEMIPGLRPFATKKEHRHRELNFNNRAIDAPLPMYKSFFDPNLSTLWKNPDKRKHLKKLGFIDGSENMVDIHEQRRKFHIVEHDVAQAEKIERQKKWDRDRMRQDCATIAQREDASMLRLQQIAGQRQERIMKR